jgi:hypothetical protein
LTFVTDYVTHVLTLLIEGRIPDAILFAEQGAAPARGLANRSRAALGHRSAGMTTSEELG